MQSEQLFWDIHLGMIMPVPIDNQSTFAIGQGTVLGISMVICALLGGLVF